MAGNIKLDITGLQKGAKRLTEELSRASRRGLGSIADEVLRLSQFEVPHDKGSLQNSGHVEEAEDYFIVGYNKVYAARLHENPQFHFQKGRKGKYLEDPIKNNVSVFKDFYQKALGGVFI